MKRGIFTSSTPKRISFSKKSQKGTQSSWVIYFMNTKIIAPELLKKEPPK